MSNYNIVDVEYVQVGATNKNCLKVLPFGNNKKT
jgi:hypothetical protein